MSRNRSTYPFIKALGDELREARENRQLSREELASKLKVKARAIATYEHATRNMTIGRLDEICDELRIDMVTLLRLARERQQNWNTRQLLFTEDAQ